ncbi:MAG: DUF2470 domain-containing protein [Sedimenticolaceae bacterium]
MRPGDEHAYAARQLLAGAFRGVISTHSLEHPGYPFGSLVPYVLGQDGRPLLLLSHLSQHTKNVDANGRSGLTVVQQDPGDVQQLGRVSAVGDITALPASPETDRYFDYFPQARTYYDELGFRFYRFEPLRFHWNGGFATARWFGADRIVRINPLNRETQLRVLAHMNRDHRDALRLYLRGRSTVGSDEPIDMVGLDAEGMDLRVNEELIRLPLTRTITSADDARAVLAEMARSDGS